MTELSIKVTIANRVYPLKVSVREEEAIRKAAKLISGKTKEYEEQYAVRDKQDLLAMCALQLATELVNATGNPGGEDGNLEKKIDDLDKMISGYLVKS